MKILDFLKTKKNRSDLTSRLAVVSRLDLLFVSENIGFGILYYHPWGATAAATAAEEFSDRVQPPSHHAQGLNIAFGSPSLRQTNLSLIRLTRSCDLDHKEGTTTTLK